MLTFDLESGPQDEDELRTKLPPFDPDTAVPVIGEFDESKVSYGNTKVKEKREAILDAAILKHYQDKEDQELNRPMLIEQAREQHWQKFIKDAALDPTKGRVLAVGFKDDEGITINHIEVKGSSQVDEAALLTYTWNRLGIAEGSLIGHDILRFDIPFFIKRSWILGVDIPAWVRQGRYFSPRFKDTKVEWFDGSTSPTNFLSLDALAGFFGLQGKHGEVTGANFAEYYWGGPEKRALAFEYLEHDLWMPWQIADRMQIL